MTKSEPRDPRDDLAAAQAEFERSREELFQAVGDLGRATGQHFEQLDLRRRITEQPYVWIAAAFTLGYALGARR